MTSENKLDQLPPENAHRQPEPGWKPWVYLASGLGFSARERALVLPELVAAIEAAGAQVFEPFRDNNEGAKSAVTQSPGWAYRIGQVSSPPCAHAHACAVYRQCASICP